MQDQTQDSTLKAKAGYKNHDNTFGITVNSYRVDNGRFAEDDFREEVGRCLPTITFCGVGAHHQNVLVERVIKYLTLTARTLLLHARRHWPEMITTMLWPMALRRSGSIPCHLTWTAPPRFRSGLTATARSLSRISIHGDAQYSFLTAASSPT